MLYVGQTHTVGVPANSERISRETNDFLHSEAACAHGGKAKADIAALPDKLLLVANALRQKRRMGRVAT